jgi:hypothetical protein
VAKSFSFVVKQLLRILSGGRKHNLVLYSGVSDREIPSAFQSEDRELDRFQLGYYPLLAWDLLWFCRCKNALCYRVKDYFHWTFLFNILKKT